MSGGTLRSPVSVDRLLEKLGVAGRYQILQATWLFISNITIAFQLLNVVFIAQDVTNQCAKPKVTTDRLRYTNITYGQCDVTRFNESSNITSTSQCISYNYQEGKHHSIVSEWDLVCDKAALSRLPQTLFVLGQGIGALLFSVLSDKFGRKPFLIGSHICTCILGFALAFSPNIETFMILRCISGAFQQAVVINMSTVVLEIFPRNRRVEVATVSAIVWSFCPVFLALVGYLLRHETWGTQQIVFSSLSLCFLLQLFLLDESLRWLVTNNKDKRATTVLKKASKLNNVNAQEVLALYEKEQVVELSTIPSEVGGESKPKEKSEAEMYKFWNIVSSKFMLKLSVIVWITWMVDSLTYFSLYLTSSSLADDLYLNFFLNSLAEVPTGPLFWFISRRFGRRKFFMFFHMMTGVCLLIATMIRGLAGGEAASVGATVFAFVGKIGSAACFTSLFVYVPEIYPTNLRSVGLGAGSAAARVGAGMAPFTKMLVDEIPWLPGTIFGVACVFVSLLGILLPEPAGRELPETIQQIKSWEGDKST